MAADLDVDIVGREFVRQYYTILSLRPDHLHQFFTNDSSFVHGGLERPGEEQPAFIGQAVIHQKILSLNLRNCHTKIRQVDCQKTVGNAVLVQVSGELSNNGEPMRKFMETFVLGQQTPKSFYVHNNIFRYQDEVFQDYHYGQQLVEHLNSEDSYVNHEMVKQDIAEVQQQAVINQIPASMESISNGCYAGKNHVVVPQMINHEGGPAVVAASPPEANVNGSLQGINKIVPQEVPEKLSEPQQVEDVPVENGPRKETFEEKPAQVPVQPQQQKISWASLASKNAASPSSAAAPQSKPQATIKPERKSEVASVAPQVVPVASSAAPSVPAAKGQMTSPQARAPAITERKWSPDGEDTGFRSPPSFVPDNQQLFIGNLPHSITEQEIRELFEKFGSVIDIKINRKGASRDLPNFGFVAFDSHEAVGKAMKAKPILLHGKRRINIEEKKDQSSVGNGPRRIPARGGRGGMRGGPRPSAPRTNGGNQPGSQVLAADPEE